MKITFVGTGSGKTSLDQFHSSLFLSSANYNLLVDAGDGISRALLSNKINFNSINGILITHLHPDHFSGLPTLIIQLKMMNRTNPLDIYIHHSLKPVVQDILLHSYIIPERLKFEIGYATFHNDERFDISNNFSLIAKQNSHLSKLEIYKKQYPQLSLYSASFLFEVDRIKMIYTSDIGSSEDLFLFKEIHSDIFITESTHIKVNNLLNSIARIDTNRIYLTHFDEEVQKGLSAILATLDPELQKKVEIAKDGLSFEI